MQIPNKNKKNHPLRTERLQRQWSQRELTERVGATIATVKRWERQVTLPGPYFSLKLTALFGKSEEELGFSDEKTPSTLRPGEECGQKEEVILPFSSEGHEVPLQEEYSLLPLPSQETTQREFALLSDSSQQNIQDQRIQGQDVPDSKDKTPLVQATQNISKPRNPRQHPFIFPFILALSCTIALICWPAWLFLQQKVTSLPVPAVSSPSSSTDPSGQILYEAHWTQGLDNWSVSEHSTWSGSVGGEIITDGGNGNDILVAPYIVPRASYAVEASIKRIGYTHLGGDTYGLVVRNNAQKGGYIAGVGAHFPPEHFFLGLLTRAGDNGSEYVSSDLARSPAHLETQWHVYRIEVRGSKMLYFVDKTLVAQGSNSKYTRAGNVGIYIDSARIAVRSFKLMTL